MSLRQDFANALRAYCDGGGDLDLMLAYGTPGYRIEVRNETQDTGQGWSDPSLMWGMAAAVESTLTQLTEENLEISNPLGQSSYTLAKMPIGDVFLTVHKNGVLLRRGVQYSRTGLIVQISGALHDWFCFRYRWAD